MSHPGFELVLSCPFPTTITITPRAPPVKIYMQLRYTHKGRYGISVNHFFFVLLSQDWHSANSKHLFISAFSSFFFWETGTGQLTHLHFSMFFNYMAYTKLTFFLLLGSYLFLTFLQTSKLL